MNAAKKKTKVWWSASEKKVLVDSAYELITKTFENPKELPSLGRGGLVKLLLEAQTSAIIAGKFDKQRERKSFPNLTGIKWFGVDLSLKVRSEYKEPQAPAAVSAPIATDNSPAQKVKELIQSIVVTIEGSSLYKDLVEEVAQVVAQNLYRDALKRAQELASQGPVDVKKSEIVIGEKPVTKKLPKVVVIGLLPHQLNEIEAEFEGRLRVMNVVSDAAASNRGCEVCKDADHVVLMTKFIKHSAEANIKKATDKWERIPGGMTDLKRHLEHKFPAVS